MADVKLLKDFISYNLLKSYSEGILKTVLKFPFAF